MKTRDDNHLTFGGHLEVLRQMLFRVLGVTLAFSILIFLLKDIVWSILLAPSEWDFVTYRYIENFIQWLGFDFQFDKYAINMIATDLSSQFITHITTSIYLGALISSPYILYELLRFVSPALYENERKSSVYVIAIIYSLFILGIMMSYFVIFPISFRFLGTYSVADKVNTMINLDSYVSSFTVLTLVMGLVFQLPVIIFVLAKLGIVNFKMLAKNRKYALFITTVISAIVTPPDVMTCILVTLPLYILYECSIWIAKKVDKG